jgi:hypothetical protein
MEPQHHHNVDLEGLFGPPDRNTIRHNSRNDLRLLGGTAFCYRQSQDPARTEQAQLILAE